MNVIQKIRERAKKEVKKIILPETKDKRVLEAARFIEKEKIAEIILLDKSKLDYKKIKKYARVYYELRKQKGMTLNQAEKIVSDPVYYAAMMVRHNEADGFVAGAVTTTPDVARAAIHCIGIDERYSVVSSSFIMEVPNCELGEEGVFLFADCGIIPEPTSRQLACIAITTSELAKKVLGITPRVAMLSYSTKGSASGRLPDKVKEAVKMAKEMSPRLCLDGELQLDSAIVPEVAKIKDPKGTLKGQANILIFPNLEAGNIGYKLTQRLSNARAVGPILQGLNKPCSDLSRGCNVDDIIDCVAVTAIRAQINQ
ncbi:MAG: phosphate acetyltransferase [Candidatus Omnitrophota bacterium]